MMTQTQREKAIYEDRLKAQLDQRTLTNSMNRMQREFENAQRQLEDAQRAIEEVRRAGNLQAIGIQLEIKFGAADPRLLELARRIAEPENLRAMLQQIHAAKSADELAELWK